MKNIPWVLKVGSEMFGGSNWRLKGGQGMDRAWGTSRRGWTITDVSSLFFSILSKNRFVSCHGIFISACELDGVACFYSKGESIPTPTPTPTWVLNIFILMLPLEVSWKLKIQEQTSLMGVNLRGRLFKALEGFVNVVWRNYVCWAKDILLQQNRCSVLIQKMPLWS